MATYTNIHWSYTEIKVDNVKLVDWKLNQLWYIEVNCWSC